ncbi:MAG: HD domain-containing protein [Anaerolineae bacterium]|nr:HD domain-containing protein [Anaerolineae bacterium]
MNQDASSPTVRQSEIVMALSLATDLGTGRPMEWAMRSALLGVRMGDALGFSDQELREVYYCALLLYVGCSSEVQIALRLFGDDPATVIASVDYVDQGDPQAMGRWMGQHLGVGLPPNERQEVLENAGALVAQYKQGHCEVARWLAERLDLEPSVRHVLWHMAEKWNGEGVPRGVQGDDIPRAMRLVLLIRDLEPYLNTHGVDAAIAIARQRGGVLHDPHFASRFCDLAHSLCATLEEDASWDTLVSIEPLRRAYSDAQFDQAALVLGDFIDLISPYFTGHARNVASLSQAAGRAYGLPEGDVKTLWRAALVHDLGKIAVPHGYWNRPRPLSSSEWERVRLHPYYTQRILARPDGLAQLARVGACHHEHLDGSGYHRGVGGDSLSPLARILTAANFYCARSEIRPNRDALTAEGVAGAMKQQVRAGWLDGDAVNSVLQAAGHHTTPVRRERLAGLSEREIEVLRLLAQGMTNRQISESLSISEKTTSTHVMHVYEKIGCSTRSAATLFAMQNNLMMRFEA